MNERAAKATKPRLSPISLVPERRRAWGCDLFLRSLADPLLRVSAVNLAALQLLRRA